MKKNVSLKEYLLILNFALSNAIIRVWNNFQIKYCFFNLQQIMERKRKSYIDLYIANIEVKELFKRIRTLRLISPNYIYDVFALIKSKNKFIELYSFLDYFEDNFLNSHEID